MEQAKAALEFSIDLGQVGEWDLDLVHNIPRRSRRHDQCFGYDHPIAEQDWGNQPLFDHVYSSDRAEVEIGFRAAADGGPDWDSEFRVVWNDGNVHWLIARGRRYGNQTSARMVGIVLDITTRNFAEAVLRETKAALDFALEATDVGDWDLNLETARRAAPCDTTNASATPLRSRTRNGGSTPSSATSIPRTASMSRPACARQLEHCATGSANSE